MLKIHMFLDIAVCDAKSLMIPFERCEPLRLGPPPAKPLNLAPFFVQQLVLNFY